MQTATDGAVNAVAEEPPSKNLRIARRGVAAGITTAVTGLLLAVYASGNHWDYHVGTIIFFAAVLVTAAVASLTVAAFGYGAERSARNCAAGNADLLAHISTMLVEAEVDRVRREHRSSDRLVEAVKTEVAEQLERERTILRLRPKEQERTVAKVPRQRRRGRRGGHPGVPAEGGNVIPMQAKRAADALRRLKEQLGDESDA